MKTLKQIRDRVMRDLKTEREEYFTKENYDDFINDGIENAARILNSLPLSAYYLAKVVMPINNTQIYDLPETIYPDKIVSISIKKDIVPKLTGGDRFLNKYGWYLDFDGVTKDRQLNFSFTPDGDVRIDYMILPKKLVADTDVCDLPGPSAIRYVEWYVKRMCAIIEQSSLAGTYTQLLEEAKTEMKSDLQFQTKGSQKLPYDDTLIQKQKLARFYNMGRMRSS